MFDTSVERQYSVDTRADLWLPIQAGLPCINKSVAKALNASVFYF